MHEHDRIRLRHMLDSAREAVSFVAGRTRKDLDTDRQLVLAVTKSIEIIGEAAAGVSEQVRSQTPQIPWRAIVAMRHRLVHGYYDINLDIVWSTLVEDLPDLMAALEPLLLESDGG